MRTKYKILAFLFLTIGLWSCETNPVIQDITSSGYLEYQYEYKLNGVSSLAYKRVLISDAAYALYDANTLDSSFIKKGFRKLELYLYSKECNPDSVNQPLGASYAQITLVDSLGLNSNPNRVLDFTYPISTLASLGTTNRPLCSALTVNMNMMTDTLTHTNRYEYSFSGQSGKKLNILSIGNDHFQIMGNGLANSKIYTLYYYGNIGRKKNIPAN